MNPDRARRGVLVLILVAGMALPGAMGCSEDSSSSASSPLTVSISPVGTNPRTTLDLVANANVSGPNPVYTFSWTVDGVDAMISSNVVPSSRTSKHEFWEVTVTATTGGQSHGPVRDSKLIVNTPPVVSSQLRISPSRACDSADLSTTVTTFDADGDPVTVSYSWGSFATSTGFVELATTPTLSNTLTTPGENVLVLVTPNDGEDDGPVAQSGLARIIPNCLTSSPPSGGSGSASSAAAQQSASLAPPAPAAAAGVSAPAQPVSVGDYNVCSIAADGALACTGDDAFGVTEPPAGAYLQVAVAADYACAIRADDLGIACWGQPPPESGLLAAPEGAFVQLGLGPDAACGLRATGEIACWGDETSEQIAAPEGRYLYLDVAGRYGCAIAEDAAVHCWGE